MSTKYVCPGECHGVSDIPKNCGSETCSRYGQPLVAENDEKAKEHGGACCEECETKAHNDELAA